MRKRGTGLILTVSSYYILCVLKCSWFGLRDVRRRGKEEGYTGFLLNIRGEGNELPIFVQDGAQGDYERLDLPINGRQMGGFEDDFERHGVHLSRGSEDTFVMVVHDSISGSKAVDSSIDITGQDFASFAQSWPQQIFCERMASDETIDAIAGIIRM